MPSADDVSLLYMLALLAGGPALFLFGLQLLTGALKAIAGARLQGLLGMLTANRFRGVLAGASITAPLNSSTITTVLMVGFVSAGLMTLSQTVPMIMGANIGSTFTAQIIAFDVSAADGRYRSVAIAEVARFARMIAKAAQKFLIQNPMGRP